MSSTVIILLVVFGVFFGILIITGIIVAILYNSLIDKKNQVDYAFGGMDVMLKKRYDLIPNLVRTVQKYAIHERELLEKITNLRSQAVHATVTDYNNGVEMFPTNIIAGMMRLKRKQVFTIATSERQNINVGEFW